MNIVNAGPRYQIFGEELEVHKYLPNGTYSVCFNKQRGFFLMKENEIITNEDKIYGSHQKRAQKVLTAFESSNRNLGVILSGKKGIGKSLFARLIGEECYNRNIPFLIVSNAIPGIADFLSSIEQEVAVIFDEFEKTFEIRDEDNPQVELLSLFDGIDNGKKLFIITCNEVRKLNSFFLNRPGRFHYHFTLSTPTGEEIREYMSDKLNTEYHNLISNIVEFGVNAELTYDCLRAISFELNRGYSLEETLEDLNITRENGSSYQISMMFKDGYSAKTAKGRGISIDMYSNEDCEFFVHRTRQGPIIVSINPKDIEVDDYTGMASINPTKVSWHVDPDYYTDEEESKEYKEMMARELASFSLIKVKDVDKYYLV